MSLRAFTSLMLFLILSTPAVRAQQENNDVLDDIHAAYERLDFSVAEARINAALKVYTQFTPSELSDIHTVYALIFFARNDLENVRSQLSQALQLQPELVLDPVVTPPRLRELFVAIKTEQKAKVQNSQTVPDVRYMILEDKRPAAAMRSLFLPGWGQRFKGQKKKGLILTGLWGISAAGTFATHLARNRAEERYLAATTPDLIETRYQTFDTLHKVRNNLFLAATGIWVYSYADALISRGNGAFDSRQLTVTPIPDPSSPGLQARVTF